MAYTEKRKVLGEQYGIIITKPWNQKMYDHNDKVKMIMVGHIKAAIAANSESYNNLNDIAKSVTGFTYSDNEPFLIAKDLIEELDTVEGWWLNQEYSTLVKKGYCPALEQYLVGYSND